MSHEIYRETDLRVSMSHKAQTNYATQLAAADLGASGKSFRPTAGVMPSPVLILAREGPHAFSGTEDALQGNEREMLRDLQFPLSFNLNSWLIGWAAALALGNVSSVQEGATGHYTHTIKRTNPLGASGTRNAKVTSMYFEAVGPDSGRRKAIFPSLAISQFTLTFRRRELITLAMDFIGSGKEDTATAVTLPSLSTEVLLAGTNMKIEIGNQGGGLTDFTERVREATFQVTQELLADLGYIPNAATPSDGKFRSAMRFGRRAGTLTLAIEAARASTDVLTDLLNRQRKEVKITVDSGVVAGTGTANHGFVLRIPDCRFREAPIEFQDSEAVYAVQVPPDAMYEDSGIGAAFQFTVENDQPSYLA